jgi:acyl dehydratase
VSAVRVGDEIPPWTMAFVDPARMKTMAAILRDPYPVHWDRAGNERVGFGPRVINQGPLNLGYIANMLMAWAGPRGVRRLTVSFGPRVMDGDTVTARGVITAIEPGADGPVARLDVWLEREGEHVVDGTAVVSLETFEG